MSMLSRLATTSSVTGPVQFVSSSINRVTGNATNTVSAPANIQDGDLLVAVAFNQGSSVTLNSAPTGFKQHLQDSTTDNCVYLASKVASSESGSYSFTWSTTNNSTVAILVYRGASDIAPVVGTLTRNAASATATGASITPAAVAGMLVGVFAIEAATSISTDPSGMVLRTSQTAAPPSLAVYDAASNGGSATGAKTLVWGASGTNAGILFYVYASGTTPLFINSATTQNGATSTSLVINKPTNTQSGDLMIAFMSSDSTATTWTGDTGWTEVADQNAAPNLRVAYKVAGGSEPASYTFTAAASRVLAGSILTYRGASYDAIGAIASGASPITATGPTAASNYCKLLGFATRGAASITVTAPSSMTTRVTQNDATAPSYVLADETVLAGATGNRSFVVGSTTAVAGILLTIKPT